jgi:hypothetical protein
LATGGWMIWNNNQELTKNKTLIHSENQKSSPKRKINTPYQAGNISTVRKNNANKLIDKQNNTSELNYKQTNKSDKNFGNNSNTATIFRKNTANTKSLASNNNSIVSNQNSFNAINNKENNLNKKEIFEENIAITEHKIVLPVALEKTTLFPKDMVLNPSVIELHKSLTSAQATDELLAKKKINIGVGASFGYFSKLNSIENIQKQNLFLGGLDLNFELSNWLMNSGINYQNQSFQIESKYLTDTVYTAYENVWVTNIDTIYLDSSIQIVDNSGYVLNPVQKTDSIDQTGVQNLSFKYFEIPLLLGRNFNFNKHTFGILAGLGFNFLNQQKNNYYPLATFPSELIYKPKSFYVNYNLSIQYAYSLSNHWRITANVQYKHIGKNTFLPNNLVDSYLGFNFGTSWWF